MKNTPYYRSLTTLILPKNFPSSREWFVTFTEQRPIHFEIGVGNGEYLIQCARDNPDINFAGIEFRWEYVAKTLRRIHQAGLKNICLFWGDVHFVFEWLIQPQTLHKIIALFPCPWSKTRHEKYRLFSGRFLQTINNRLKNQGELLLVTDSQDFCDWVKKQNTHAGLMMQYRCIAGAYNTKYERKWQRLGQNTFYELRFRKVEHKMHETTKEVSLKSHKTKMFNPEVFQLENYANDVAVAYKEFLYDASRQKGMVRVAVAEEHLVQNLWIKIVKFREEWHIAVDPNMGIAPTRGVQKAIDLVYQAVCRSTSSTANTS